MKVHEIAVWASWHGRLMVLAWVALLPLGMLIARFYKVTPQQGWPQRLDNKFWWHSHIGLQYSGIGAMTIAAAMAWWHGDLWHSRLPWHGIIGWVVVALGWVQVLGGWLRGSKGGPQPTAQAPVETAIPGDHYEMTLRRQVFERLHKSLGYFALLLSVVAVMLGLRLADAPSWMGWAVAAIWVVGIGLFVRLQRASHCIDTYQAIWGPDLRHPGNRVEPIGIGISRGRGPGQPDHSGELTS